jgi:hypothetical protein
MHSKNKNPDVSHCFRCGNLIYNISKLYDIKINDVLYCTFCNINIKNKKNGVEN